MKIAIIGSGAIGCYYGAMLQRAGQEVFFLMRRDYQAVLQQGIKVHSYQGDFSVPAVHACRQSADIGVSDVVIISLKATDNQALTAIIPPLLGPHTLLLTLQNGLGNEEYLAQHFGAQHVTGGVCFVCLNRIGHGVVSHTGGGGIEIGDFGGGHAPQLQALNDLFNRVGVPCTVSDNLRGTRWRKLVWNIPFNGLAVTAGGITVDRILADPALLQRVRELMTDVQSGARGEGVEIPQSFLDFQIERSYPMGAYAPSTLLDFLAAKPLEVEAIWGEPLRRAEQSGQAVPALQKLYGELLAKTGVA